MNILERDNCSEFKKIIQCILDVLCLLKQAGIVHCDLKSENVLVKFDFNNMLV